MYLGFAVALPTLRPVGMRALEGIDRVTAVHTILAVGIRSHEHGRINIGVSVSTNSYLQDGRRWPSVFLRELSRCTV